MRLVRFLKDWTLPVSIGLGIIIYFVFAEIPELEPVCEWFLPLSRPILPSFMFLILFTVFCKVDFKKLRPVKWQMWVAIQQVVFVLLIVGLILVFHIHGEPLVLLEAILACVIGPCAAASSVITAKLGGCMEQMTTYTFISNFVTAILIPVCFSWYSVPGMYCIGSSDGLGVCGKAHLSSFPPLADRYQGFEFLSLGRFAGACGWHYDAQHHACQHLAAVCGRHRHPGSGAQHHPVCHRPFHRSLFRQCGGVGPGIGAEEHPIRHLGSISLLESSFHGGARLLCALAELDQFFRTVALSEEAWVISMPLLTYK